jgi:hypothetical protein
MAKSSLTYILGFSVKFFFQPIMQIRHILIKDHIEISIFGNSSHIEWRAGLSDTILKGTHPRTIPARFGLIWFCGFRGKDLNVIFYQNMSNLYNQYKSVERKNSQKNTALLQIKMNSNFNCSYMAKSSLTYILGFSVRFFQPVYSA